MSIALIGGMDRLERHYIEEAKRAGMELRVFTRSDSAEYAVGGEHRREAAKF